MQNALTIRRTIAAATLSLLRACQASAESLHFGPGCAATGDDSFKCRMLGLLNFLYVAAGLLGLILLIVIFLAIAMYRRNRAARLQKGQDDFDE